MKRIAIIGAGFAGLALAYTLSKKGHEISLFDKKGLGGGASGVAAGLMHPFVGGECRLNWRGWEGFEASLELLRVASEKLGKPVFRQEGIVRIAQRSWQEEAFLKAASDHPQDIKRLGHWKGGEAILIEKGLQVNGKEYLEGLLKACQGVTLIEKHVVNLSEFSSFDKVFIAAGAGTTALTGEKLTTIKGQLLHFAWPPSLPPLERPVIGSKYLVMSPEGDRLLAGATYEKKFENDEPDEKVALAEILPSVQKIVPEITKDHLLQVEAGVRVFSPDRRPSFREVAPSVWSLTGLGSKGLLYHALLAEMAVAEIIEI